MLLIVILNMPNLSERFFKRINFSFSYSSFDTAQNLIVLNIFFNKFIFITILLFHFNFFIPLLKNSNCSLLLKIRITKGRRVFFKKFQMSVRIVVKTAIFINANDLLLTITIVNSITIHGINFNIFITSYL